MGFVVCFRTGVPRTERDHSSPIISGNYEVYQNHVTAHHWRNHILGGSTNGVLFKKLSAWLSINEESEICQSYVTLLSWGHGTWGCVSKGLISKSSNWCPLPVYKWSYGDLAKLHAHVIMVSPATECDYFMGSSPRSGCTYYLNLMTSDYQ